MPINYKRIRSIILIFLIPVVLIFFSINTVIFNQDIYEKQIPEEKIALSNQVIDFLQGETTLLPEIFTLKETSHLKDVKNLIKNIVLVGWFSFFLFIFLFFKQPNKLKTILHGLVLTIIILAILVLATLSFSSSFTIFHQLFFQEATWTFTKDSTLVNLYPVEFFQIMTLLILVQLLKFFVVGLAILGGIKLYNKIKHR